MSDIKANSGQQWYVQVPTVEEFTKSYIESNCKEELNKSTEASLFRRTEDKYLIPKSMKAELDKVLRKNLKADYPDKDTKYTDMKSIYFDSANLDLMKNHTNSAESRFKVRTREYAPNGKLSKSNFTYLEVKAKHNGISDKFRVKLPNSTMTAFKKGLPISYSVELIKANPHIAITDLVSRISDLNKAMTTFNLRPSCEVTYSRNAFSDGNTTNGLRVTYDEDVRSNPLDLIPSSVSDSLTKDSGQEGLLPMMDGFDPKKHLILEVKHSGGNPPDWLTEFFNTHSLVKTSMSKYVYSMAKHLSKK